MKIKIDTLIELLLKEKTKGMETITLACNDCCIDSKIYFLHGNKDLCVNLIMFKE